MKPSVAVASNVQESIFYKSWLAGTLGSTDSPTAKKYGPSAVQGTGADLARGVRRTARPGSRQGDHRGQEGRAGRRSPPRSESSDPSAYEHLTGKRSDTRVGYAILSTVAALAGAAVPVRVGAAAARLVPHRAAGGDAVPGLRDARRLPRRSRPGDRDRPNGRGSTGQRGHLRDRRSRHDPGPRSHPRPADGSARLARAGADAAVRVRDVGGAQAVPPAHGHGLAAGTDPFGDAAGSFGDAARRGGRWAKRAGSAAAGSLRRATSPRPPRSTRPTTRRTGTRDSRSRTGSRPRPQYIDPAPRPAAHRTARRSVTLARAGQGQRPLEGRRRRLCPAKASLPAGAGADPLLEGHPRGPVVSEAAPLLPVEPEWVDGEEVFTVYRPGSEDADTMPPEVRRVPGDKGEAAPSGDRRGRAPHSRRPSRRSVSSCSAP